ncbi:acyltransferase family protein [Actinocrispum wychmicini]|uniref:Acyltransferase-like protein n=1 Tax=Actinocrispum wychmicini TaxID=1213861 RepID=A0A4R2JTC2_9PSEU|nr:acyltransferase [Actinocrispum wychmicini]TCO62222.1 acyltransferase-like protein [Actinocrispum wychmicini]
MTRVRELVERTEAATPPDRDRAVDALRFLAILGVVLGHWLVTGLIVDSGTVHGESPLQYLPWLTPVSWVLQTLAVFFLVGGQMSARGYLSARARGWSYGQWLVSRLGRLSRPVVVLVVVWAAVAGSMLACGADWPTVRTLVHLVMSPLWFLAVFAALTAATPLVTKLHPVWPVAVVLCVDVVRLGLDGPEWLGWVNVPVGWLVPFCLGSTWARRGVPGRGTGWALLLGGAAATAGLVLLAGYPAAMVGVPGNGISNLNPPTLAAVTFGLAQCGATVLLLGPLRRVLRRPVVWAAVALANLSAMTIYLWHLTALIAVTAAGRLTGETLPGLHTVPASGNWVLARLAWLPVFAVVLLVLCAVFRRHERGGVSKV